MQKSSFLGDLSKNKMEMLLLEINDLEIGETDAIFVIPQCKQCYGEKTIIGHLEDERIRNKEFFIFST